jgi:hypothetical protein
MNKRLTNQQFIDMAIKIHGNKYNYDKVNYNGNKNKICIICPVHGEFWQRPDSHLWQKQGCLKCSNSKGEIKISKILNKLNINFTREKTFKDLKGAGNGYLRFDFYLPDYNILIEFDGRQHFNIKYYNKYYGKHEQNDYDNLKIHDYIKTKYCKKNNIKLIRIPYYKSNKVEEILDFNLLLKKVA